MGNGYELVIGAGQPW